MKKSRIEDFVLQNFKPLTRKELREIKGGLDAQLKCNSDECSGRDPILNVNYSGTCGRNSSVMQPFCECQTTSGNFYHESCQSSPE